MGAGDFTQQHKSPPYKYAVMSLIPRKKERKRRRGGERRGEERRGKGRGGEREELEFKLFSVLKQVVLTIIIWKTSII